MPGWIQGRLDRRRDLSGPVENFNMTNIRSGTWVIIIVSEEEEWEYFTVKEYKHILSFLKIIKFVLQK